MRNIPLNDEYVPAKIVGDWNDNLAQIFHISLSESIVVYFPFRMSKPRGCVETIRVEVILCYPSSQQNLQKLESFISKSLAATQIKKIQKNFKENPCKYLQNIKLFIVKVVSKYNAQKLQRAMKRNQKLLDTSLTVSSSTTIDTVAKTTRSAKWFHWKNWV